MPQKARRSINSKEPRVNARGFFISVCERLLLGVERARLGKY
jgi:hypothetical protein